MNISIMKLCVENKKKIFNNRLEWTPGRMKTCFIIRIEFRNMSNEWIWFVNGILKSKENISTDY